MILLKNCFALYSDPADPEREPRSAVDVLIEGNLISRIRKGLTPPEGDESDSQGSRTVHIIDASRCVVVPGFVNTHHHFYQILTRNVPAVEDRTIRKHPMAASNSGRRSKRP
ncbi:MAG: hypothetical protein V3T35_11380, partial [Spirochaetia bacterium]